MFSLRRTFIAKLLGKYSSEPLCALLSLITLFSFHLNMMIWSHRFICTQFFLSHVQAQQVISLHCRICQNIDNIYIKMDKLVSTCKIAFINFHRSNRFCKYLIEQWMVLVRFFLNLVSNRKRIETKSERSLSEKFV